MVWGGGVEVFFSLFDVLSFEHFCQNLFAMLKAGAVRIEPYGGNLEVA